jgi:hypothetical protein
MLPDPLRLLMVAYASGELSPRRRHAAERLLKHSLEARELLAGLRADAKLLRQLPVSSAPADLEGQILSRIPTISAIEPLALASTSRWPRMVSALVAVGAVLCVSLVGWSVMGVTSKSTPVETHAFHKLEPTPGVETPVVSAVPTPEDRPVVAPSPPTIVVQESSKNSAAEAPTLPTPAPATNLELGSPPTETPELPEVKVPRVPEVVSASSLGNPVTIKKLVGELARGDAHRIDLFCRDPHKALDRFHAALSGTGIRTVPDAAVQSLKKRRIRSELLVFTSDLNIEDWGRVLERVYAADQRAEAKKPGDGVFDQVVLMPLVPADQKELAGILGQDLIAQTGDSEKHNSRGLVGGAAADQTGESRRKSEAGQGGRQSIAVAPGHSSHLTSSEIRQYLESRRPPMPGTISVVIVIRPVA